MQKITIITLGAVAAFFTGTMTSSAGTNPGVDHRQKTQMKRIHQGAKNGSLNANEAARLLHHQAKIQRMKRRINADGVVTPHERARLHHALNRNHFRIRRKKHN